jgi:hypothetical protein
MVGSILEGGFHHLPGIAFGSEDGHLGSRVDGLTTWGRDLVRMGGWGDGGLVQRGRRHRDACILRGVGWGGRWRYTSYIAANPPETQLCGSSRGGPSSVSSSSSVQSVSVNQAPKISVWARGTLGRAPRAGCGQSVVGSGSLVLLERAGEIAVLCCHRCSSCRVKILRADQSRPGYQIAHEIHSTLRETAQDRGLISACGLLGVLLLTRY